MTEELGHYVYALMDPRDEVIFYVGKGQGSRPSAHIKEASSKQIESRKAIRIRDIQNSGKKVRTLILARDFAEDGEAYAIETLLIIQARASGDLMGIKSDLTNIARGHHEGRFRDWGHHDKLAGFEYRKPESSYAESFKKCQPLYDYIIQNVREFRAPLRDKGRFIRSAPNEKGFEFVVYPKQAQFIHFEYIRRKLVSEEQVQHVEKLRRLIGYGGVFDYPKVDYPRHDLLIDQHEEVAEALREFISDIKRAESKLQNQS
jgi:hypothetical protein